MCLILLTDPETAVELEISPATARRDLEALSMAGIPAYSQPGEARVLSRMLGTAAVNDPETRVTTMKFLLALPSCLRSGLARIGSELVAHYGSAQ